ncbi:uncharacterized protein LOC105699377 [Orussus abietinus]|uniref:uncharacterized protein LOC105699377 n=1 Tax=Orussus abietinus TaxID=222816 RepID=UPI0006260694|nr:uncharacterized protein LOC105699377 [Orussus abietinus]
MQKSMLKHENMMKYLNEYERYVVEIRSYAKENNITETEINEIFEDCFCLLKRKYAKRTIDLAKIVRIVVASILILCLCLVFIYNHPYSHRFLLRNLQDFIYPGMRVLRKFAVPVITTFPWLTEFYDEWCLVENPFFRVKDMDCRPCESVKSVIDLTGYNVTSTFDIGLPFIRRESHKEVTFSDLVEMYRNNHMVFDKEAYKVSSNNGSFRTIADMIEKRMDLYPSDLQLSHISWRINRMHPARSIRKLFPRPAEVPNWLSQSTEKFIFIDEPKAPSYALPNAECSNIVIRLTSGDRLIRLMPSPDCAQKCKPFTVLLSSSYTLWYNWWYWRPVSLPLTNSSTIAVSYMTSFC